MKTYVIDDFTFFVLKKCLHISKIYLCEYIKTSSNIADILALSKQLKYFDNLENLLNNYDDLYIKYFDSIKNDNINYK